MKNKYLIRNFYLFVAFISSFLLTACGGGGGGGGGGGSTPQATTNIKVSIDGSIFPNTSMRAAKDNKIASLTLKTSAYSKGKLQKGNIPDRFATKSGSNYVCNVQGLVNGLDYRFSAYHNGKKLMENQISASELQKDAEIPVDIDTSLKTLAYDSWNARNPSNASVDNFMKNCENTGILNKEDFQAFFDPDIYKQKIVNIINGDEKTSIPTVKDINTSIIEISDTEIASKPVSISEEAIIGKWYLSLSDNIYIEPDSKDNIPSIEFKKDHSFIEDISYYQQESQSVRANNSIRLSSNTSNQNIATGTWSYEYSKLTLKYSDGNKKNDEEYSYKVEVANDSLIWTIIGYDGKKAITYEEIYKKTKNQRKEYIITGSFSSLGNIPNLTSKEISGISKGILIYSEADPSNYANIYKEDGLDCFKIHNLKPGDHYIVFKHIPNGESGISYICRSSKPIVLTENNRQQSCLETLRAQECSVVISGKVTDDKGKAIVPSPILTLWGQKIVVDALTGEFTTPMMHENTVVDLIVNAINYKQTSTPLTFSFNPAYYEIMAVDSTQSNLPPTINLTSKNANYSKGSKVTLTATAQDSNNNELEFQWEIESCTAPNQGTLEKGTSSKKGNKFTSEYYWNAPEFDCLATISVKVYEKQTSKKLSATAKLKLAIGTGVYKNSPPVIVVISVNKESLYGNTTYTITCDALDEDGDELTYFLSIAPNSGSLSKSKANTWTWRTPDIDSATTYTLNFEVKDPKGNKATSNKKLTVQPTQENQPPIIVSVTPSETIYVISGAEVNFSVIASDPEDEKLTFSWSIKKGEIISSSKTDTTANATWRAPYLNSITQTTISCIVKDPYGESSSYDFNIEIIPAP